MAGGAAVWCWYGARAVVLPSPIWLCRAGRGAISYRRGIIGPARGGVLPVQRPAAAGRGIIGPARPVRGDLSGGAGCCCPLLYSYVWRRAVCCRHHRRGAGCRSAASSARRGRRRGAICPASSGGGRGIIGPARESRPRKTPHGKRATKKR